MSLMRAPLGAAVAALLLVTRASWMPAAPRPLPAGSAANAAVAAAPRGASRPCARHGVEAPSGRGPACQGRNRPAAADLEGARRGVRTGADALARQHRLQPRDQGPRGERLLDEVEGAAL